MMNYEVLFVEDLQDFVESRLDDFIFEYRYSEWAFLGASGFGNVNPFDRLRDVCNSVEPADQVDQIFPWIFSILLFGYVVYARGGVVPQPLEAFCRRCPSVIR